MRVTTHKVQTDELVQFALQPIKRLAAIADAHAFGRSNDVARAHRQPSTFLCLTEMHSKAIFLARHFAIDFLCSFNELNMTQGRTNKNIWLRSFNCAGCCFVSFF